MAVPCTNEAPHLFLTGEKGVGKSTLLRKLLGGRRAGGFRTVKAVYSGRTSLHLLRLDRAETPCAENFLCFCPPGGDREAARRFDRLGCAALGGMEGAEVLVMDELGPAEENAKAFQAAVLQALEGETPILGVLQKADTPFLRRIAHHPNVRLVEVTQENRDILF